MFLYRFISHVLNFSLLPSDPPFKNPDARSMMSRQQPGIYGVTRWIIALLFCRFSNGFTIVMDWNNTHYFGPDGPWNALLVGVGDETVNLLPGGIYASSWILTPSVCAPFGNDAACGVGGTVDTLPPIISQGQPLADLGVADDTPSNSIWQLVGNDSREAISVGDLSGVIGQTQQSWNASVVATLNSNITYPSGKVLGPEVGIFNIGGDAVADDSDACPNDTCDPTTYLFKQGLISSKSWSLQIGAAALNYPGSLILGGYDRGRTIGPPYTGTPEVQFRLSDINIGVETGGSPFPFGQQAGLLMTEDNEIAAEPIDIEIKPWDAYIYLPQPTIDAITNKLPVYFDKTSHYYLWNTSDPSYEKVVTSASYLGFVFEDPSGTNTTVKVPFMLLNLTLQSTASGLKTDVPYFPVQPMTLAQDGLGYTLGRAFLQAATLTVNYGGSGYFWITQAPGPGASKRGLGYEVQDIAPSATTLDFNTGDDLFNQSWAGIWTPLPLAEADLNQPKGLSGGAIAGIVVGSVAFVALIAGLAAFLITRRRRSSVKELDADQDGLTMDRYEKNGGLGEPAQTPEMDGAGARHELLQQQRYELSDQKVDVQEMPDHDARHEMPGHDERCDAKELPSEMQPVELPSSK